MDDKVRRLKTIQDFSKNRTFSTFGQKPFFNTLRKEQELDTINKLSLLKAQVKETRKKKGLVEKA